MVAGRAGRRIGLLTGTFDPVHLGHVAMARSAMTACGLQEVWFLVNPTSGHKRGVTSLEDRLAMVQLALADELGLKVGEVFAHRMAEFERLMGKFPDTDFVFIVGSDVLAAMRRWEDYEPALERAEFAVATRPGHPADLDPRLRAVTFELKEYTAASSRDIQRQLADGERPDELDARVYEYIRDKRLYL